MSTGILLINLGTPAEPTPKAIRSYLAEFLSDPYVVQIPKLAWYPILYGVILPFRSRRLAHSYQTIWMEGGSPLLVHTKRLGEKLQTHLGEEYSVETAMRYGKPSIESALEKLKNTDHIIVLPLYPQFNQSTTKTCWAEVQRVFKQYHEIPSFTFISHYEQHPAYIDALAQSIIQFWTKTNTKNHLLISFHGVPQRVIREGDPYQSHCEATTRLLIESLPLNNSEFTQSYQSRFGAETWLQPYTDQTLIKLAKQGTHDIDVICPGFSADCLETLEEISITNKNLFIEAGGKTLRYIPALNDSDLHVNALSLILKK